MDQPDSLVIGALDEGAAVPHDENSLDALNAPPPTWKPYVAVFWSAVIMIAGVWGLSASKNTDSLRVMFVRVGFMFGFFHLFSVIALAFRLIRWKDFVIMGVVMLPFPFLFWLALLHNSTKSLAPRLSLLATYYLRTRSPPLPCY